MLNFMLRQIIMVHDTYIDWTKYQLCSGHIDRGAPRNISIVVVEAACLQQILRRCNLHDT